MDQLFNEFAKLVSGISCDIDGGNIVVYSYNSDITDKKYSDFRIYVMMLNLHDGNAAVYLSADPTREYGISKDIVSKIFKPYIRSQKYDVKNIEDILGHARTLCIHCPHGEHTGAYSKCVLYNSDSNIDRCCYIKCPVTLFSYLFYDIMAKRGIAALLNN